MTIEYILKFPVNMTDLERRDFEYLLKKQGQIDKVEGKLEQCHKVCLVKLNGESVGIGALKQVYKSPFNYAGVNEIQYEYNYEVGYLFVDKETIDKDSGSLGLGKYITRLLLNEVAKENVFATTEYNKENPMFYILKSFGFKISGNPYQGKTTKKEIVLMVLNR
tara:strand:- start:2756 stop:3247 length:492 start_codon:yes stop_codon:yes gene_type:complete